MEFNQSAIKIGRANSFKVHNINTILHPYVTSYIQLRISFYGI